MDFAALRRSINNPFPIDYEALSLQLTQQPFSTNLFPINCTPIPYDLPSLSLSFTNPFPVDYQASSQHFPCGLLTFSICFTKPFPYRLPTFPHGLPNIVPTTYLTTCSLRITSLSHIDYQPFHYGLPNLVPAANLKNLSLWITNNFPIDYIALSISITDLPNGLPNLLPAAYLAILSLWTTKPFPIDSHPFP